MFSLNTIGSTLLSAPLLAMLLCSLLRSASVLCSQARGLLVPLFETHEVDDVELYRLAFRRFRVRCFVDTPVDALR